MSAGAETPTAAPDIVALRACWHPVAFAAELEDKPIARKLLGEALALYRDSSGTARAVSDLCIHRGTAISLGWVDGDEIVCPYHGWHYGTDGASDWMQQDLQLALTLAVKLDPESEGAQFAAATAALVAARAVPDMLAGVS
ncbi:MAG: Rieske 2Fe-2S domain-containing protein [Actinoallomurus sp.]